MIMAPRLSPLLVVTCVPVVTIYNVIATPRVNSI